MGLLEDGIVRDKTILIIEKNHCEEEKNNFLSAASFDISSLLKIRKGLKIAAMEENRPDLWHQLYYSPQPQAQKGTKRLHSPPRNGRFVWDKEWEHWIPQPPRQNPPPKPRRLRSR
jgi:hypothetical protein